MVKCILNLVRIDLRYMGISSVTYKYRKAEVGMELTWLNNIFMCEDLCAPFKLDRDIDYLENLKEKYEIVKQQALSANADKESLSIIDLFSKKILESLKLYYKADIAESNQIILDLVEKIGDNPLAVNLVNNSEAFPGKREMNYNFLEVD